MKKILIYLLVIAIVSPVNTAFASEHAGRIDINKFMGIHAAPKLTAYNTLDLKTVDLNPANLKSLQFSDAYDFRRGGPRAGIIIGVTAVVVVAAVLIVVIAARRN